MPNFSIPLTGLNATSTALNTIANNLSNMSTTAYKDQTTEFADMFYQSVGSTGSGDAIQVGAGVKVAANATDFTQGSISSTGSANDVAINGNGYFVVSDGSSSYEYTRAGNFTLTSDGALVSSNGLSVMGYPAVSGVVNTSASLTAVTVPVGQVLQPSATTTVSMTTTLNATSASGDTYPGQVTVYDSLGEAHVVTVTYTDNATNPPSWDFSATIPTAETSGVAETVTGTMNFDSSGNLTSITQGGVTTTVGTATGDVSSIALSFTGLTDGAADLNMTWNLLDSSDSAVISQVDATSTVSATSQDGYQSGTYKSFAIGSDGSVTVTYSNDQTKVVGQLALANVTNEQGLKKLGDGDYSTTLASGAATVGVSGSGGLGTLEGSSLEGSNVNISSEFANLIVAQRAFEANSKAVTTFDTVTQTAINMIH